MQTQIFKKKKGKDYEKCKKIGSRRYYDGIGSISDDSTGQGRGNSCSRCCK